MDAFASASARDDLPGNDDDDDSSRTLDWAHGHARLQRLGAMLAPVVFRAEGHADFSPLQIAPWADEPGSGDLPGILQRLRGDWPCVPFGRSDRPEGLPPGWQARQADDDFGHGFGSHHAWRWLATDEPLELALAIDYPLSSPVRRLVRRVRALAHAPVLEMTLEVEVRAPCRLPVALHPVLRLDAGEVRLQVPHTAPARAYPVPAEAGVSRLVPGAAFESLQAAPLADGGSVDLSRYPLPFDTEELLQLQSVDGPAVAEFVDQGWALELDWDHAALPDMMLWVSHRGRRYAPWSGRHWALGLEPLNGVFDLGRVAVPPPDHPLASRSGIALTPAEPWRLRSQLRGRPTARPVD